MDAPEDEFRSEEAKLQFALKTAMAGLVHPDNPMPDLIDLLGYEKTMELIFVFGGRKVRFPNIRDIIDVVNVAAVAVAIDSGRMSLLEAVYQRGMAKTELETVVEALQRYRAVSTKLSEEKMALLRKAGLFDLMSPRTA